MEKQLAILFPSFKELSEYPLKASKESYVFQHAEKDSWFTVHRKEVSERDYTLLTALYTEIQTAAKTDSRAAQWISYLDNDGESPLPSTVEIRIIQLFFDGQKIEQADLTKASCAFFGDAVQLVPLSPREALLIETKTSMPHEPENFSSYMSALESDFYIKAKMYIGKFHPADAHFSCHFKTEKEWFQKALASGNADRLFTMEKLYPMHLMEQMPANMKEILAKEVLRPLGYDPEILQTVRTFFENGFNASVASKKLYIHRNTLQYRLNKFQEITGISLKDFDGALVAYCASMIASPHES